MTGNDSIDFGLKNLYKSWFNYRKGKKPNIEIDTFQYNLEKELFNLHKNLSDRTYRHGGYRKFVVCDNKKREISVASIRDRLVHRLVYDYLTPIYDKTFIYDAWSCRIGKGLVEAIERTQRFLRQNPHTYIWKSDIRKFFDNVDHRILFKILSFRIHDKSARWLLQEVIESFPIGMPIGNLTSQIFANIYLNELDRFVKHKLKAKAYLRYGDDFILIHDNLEIIRSFRREVKKFITNELKLIINNKCDKTIKISQGLKFLGMNIWQSGRTLNKRNHNRIISRLNLINTPSYYGIIKKHENNKKKTHLDWLILSSK